jgi:hypothetical protein
MIVCGCVRVARDMVSLRQKLVSLDRTGRETFAGAGWFWTVRVPMSKLGHSSVRRVIERAEKLCFQEERRFASTLGCLNLDTPQTELATRGRSVPRGQGDPELVCLHRRRADRAF